MLIYIYCLLNQCNADFLQHFILFALYNIHHTDQEENVGEKIKNTDCLHNKKEIILKFDNIKEKGKCNHQINENNKENNIKKLFIHEIYSDEKIGIYEIEEQENNNNGNG